MRVMLYAVALWLGGNVLVGAVLVALGYYRTRDAAERNSYVPLRPDLGEYVGEDAEWVYALTHEPTEGGEGVAG